MTIDNWDDMWKCEHERRNEKNLWAGIILLALNLFLITEYVDKYKSSQARLREIAERQQAMALTLKDHYLAVTHPQKIHALSSALSMPMPSLHISCLSINEDALRDSMLEQSEIVSRKYDFCFTHNADCNQSIAIASKMGEVDSSYARVRFQARRYERRMVLKRQIVQQAHQATIQQPAGIFQLMDGASDIYSTIFTNAKQNLAGAVQGFGYGLKLLS